MTFQAINTACNVIKWGCDALNLWNAATTKPEATDAPNPGYIELGINTITLGANGFCGYMGFNNGEYNKTRDFKIIKGVELGSNVVGGVVKCARTGINSSETSISLVSCIRAASEIVVTTPSQSFWPSCTTQDEELARIALNTCETTLKIQRACKNRTKSTQEVYAEPIEANDPVIQEITEILDLDNNEKTSKDENEISDNNFKLINLQSEINELQSEIQNLKETKNELNTPSTKTDLEMIRRNNRIKFLEENEKELKEELLKYQTDAEFKNNSNKEEIKKLELELKNSQTIKDTAENKLRECEIKIKEQHDQCAALKKNVDLLMNMRANIFSPTPSNGVNTNSLNMTSSPLVISPTIQKKPNGLTGTKTSSTLVIHQTTQPKGLTQTMLVAFDDNIGKMNREIDSSINDTDSSESDEDKWK